MTLRVLRLKLIILIIFSDGKTGWFPSNYVEEISDKSKVDAAEKEIPGILFIIN